MPRKQYASDRKWNERRRSSAAEQIAAELGPRSSPRSSPSSTPAPRAKTRRSQSPPSSGSAERNLPTPATDFGAFTRPRGATRPRSTPALPTLAELAAEEAPELADVAGGACACGAPMADDARHCGKCGRALRHECPKCRRALARDQLFCAECGVAAPSSAPSSPPPSSPPAAELVHLAPPELGPDWEADDLFWFSSGVDMLLVHWDADPLENKPRERMNERAAIVANKHFRIGGKWKAEIALGMCVVGALWPAAYSYYVLAPKERRRAVERAAAAAAPAVEAKKS